MNRTKFLEQFIIGLPMAELHLHIEGTLEPELVFKIAERNQIKIKYNSSQELRRAYKFNNLQDFLNLYYEIVSVLKTEQDFYDMTIAYLRKAHSQNILHTEIFFDPQTHTSRGIAFSTVIRGVHRALREGRKKMGISTKLIMCFLRHLDEKVAIKSLKQALKYRPWIVAIGLDSSEVGCPPSKFKRVFCLARQAGFLTVAHAGEEGPAEYIWEALKLLQVSRIDHGNSALDDKKLIKELVKRQVPLTLCPLSNLALRVVKKLTEHPLKIMMQKGLLVTINSDDPAYLGGYLKENYLAVQKALNLDFKDIYQLAKNSFLASFLDAEQKNEMIKKLDDYVKHTI